MLPSAVASQLSSRCSTAVLAASPASFQPSKAATNTGSTRRGSSPSVASIPGVSGSRSVIGPAYGGGGPPGGARPGVAGRGAPRPGGGASGPRAGGAGPGGDY